MKSIKIIFFKFSIKSHVFSLKKEIYENNWEFLKRYFILYNGPETSSFILYPQNSKKTHSPQNLKPLSLPPSTKRLGHPCYGSIKGIWCVIFSDYFLQYLFLMNPLFKFYYYCIFVITSIQLYHTLLQYSDTTTA